MPNSTTNKRVKAVIKELKELRKLYLDEQAELVWIRTCELLLEEKAFDVSVERAIEKTREEMRWPKWFTLASIAHTGMDISVSDLDTNLDKESAGTTSLNDLAEIQTGYDVDEHLAKAAPRTYEDVLTIEWVRTLTKEQRVALLKNPDIDFRLYAVGRINDVFGEK